MAVIESKLQKNDAFARQAEHWRSEVARLREEEAKIRLGGGEKAQAKQRAQGKMTARERVAALCDPGSPFLELGLWVAHGFYEEYGGAPAAGVVVGIGQVHGRDDVVVANDATVKAGAWFPLTCKKVLRAQEIALENRLPIVYLVDSAGVFLPLQDEIFPDKEHFGRAFYNNARLSAEGVFQMAAIMGSCVAGGAYLPIMSDESHIVEGTGSIFLAGPHLVQAAIGEKIGIEELGGALVQCDVSGVVDHRHPNDATCLAKIRSQLAQLAQLARGEEAPFARREPAAPLSSPEELYGVLPIDRTRPYDAHELLARLLDGCGARRVQGDLRQDARLRHRLDRRPGGGRGRQPALDRGAEDRSGRGRQGAADRRRHLLGLGGQGGALRRALQPEEDPAALPAGRHRLHGRQPRRARRHHQGRRQDGERRRQLGGAEDHALRRQLLRRGQLRDVRQGLRPALRLRLAVGRDRGDGRRPGVEDPAVDPAQEPRRRGLGGGEAAAPRRDPAAATRRR